MYTSNCTHLVQITTNCTYFMKCTHLAKKTSTYALCRMAMNGCHNPLEYEIPFDFLVSRFGPHMASHPDASYTVFAQSVPAYESFLRKWVRHLQVCSDGACHGAFPACSNLLLTAKHAQQAQLHQTQISADEYLANLHEDDCDESPSLWHFH
jgi:hypothetical protein